MNNKLLQRPQVDQSTLDVKSKFERFGLKENPFPSEPYVNKESSDERINGSIFEIEVREKEYDQFKKNFLEVSQTLPTHLRLGFVIESSFIGRGNGKSAFLLELQRRINHQYCLDISNGKNKCFSIYVYPEPGGRTKSFGQFVDLLFDAILRSNIINNCLAILRAEAFLKLVPNPNLDEFPDEESFAKAFNSKELFEKHNVDLKKLNAIILENEYLKELPQDFPLYATRSYISQLYSNSLFTETLPLHDDSSIITQDFFKNYFFSLRKDEKLDFIFTHLVKFFLASGFNGAYVLVDDFERILDFQSARQKRDFALELRTFLYDGYNHNAKIGFFNLILTLHPGVTRLIDEAWRESGMENRAPISSSANSNHIIQFEKLSFAHVILLIKKYLNTFRINADNLDSLQPFTENAINLIAEKFELNPAKILKASYEILDKASADDSVTEINETYVANYFDSRKSDDSGSTERHQISNAESEDLHKKIRNS